MHRSHFRKDFNGEGRNMKGTKYRLWGKTIKGSPNILLDLHPDWPCLLKYVATFGQKFPIILKNKSQITFNWEKAVPYWELWQCCSSRWNMSYVPRDLCTKGFPKPWLLKCVEQGEGGEKQEEQVESREQMLLSSQLDEALEEFDI